MPEELSPMDSLCLKVMDEYYENFITMSLIIFISKRYITRGEMIILKDFDSYTIDYKNRTIYFMKHGHYTIRFYSGRFFRFLGDCRNAGIIEKEILPRLVKNGFTFCVPMGYSEVPYTHGVKYIRFFEAVGFATEYIQNYKSWRSNSMVFATYNKELRKKINEERKNAGR